jgi:hypothetical protein
VPIPDHPRSVEEYRELGQRLIDCDIPVLFSTRTLQECWLTKYLDWRGYPCTHAVGDNPAKNSLAYHVVQANKTEWLVETLTIAPDADVLVWIDFGIFHVPGVTNGIVESFVRRVEGERAIVVPGCWDKNPKHADNRPNWRFCGGVMVVPREYVILLDHAIKREYIRRLTESNFVTWEVNVLAAVEQCNSDLPIWWYKADHDSTIFTNYRSSQSADSPQHAQRNSLSTPTSREV